MEGPFMNRLLLSLAISALSLSTPAFSDDRTPSQPLDEQKQYDGKDAYGAAPLRTPEGTPLIGDFDRTTTPNEKRQDANPVPSKQPSPNEPAKGKS